MCTLQKSPPLRKGKYANPRGKAEAPSDLGPLRSSDPGMVIAFDSKVPVTPPPCISTVQAVNLQPSPGYHASSSV